MATLPVVWRYWVNPGTGWPGVSILSVGEVESLVCNLCRSVAARKLVWAGPFLRYTRMLLGRYATNKQTCFVRFCLISVVRLANMPEQKKHREAPRARHKQNIIINSNSNRLSEKADKQSKLANQEDERLAHKQSWPQPSSGAVMKGTLLLVFC